MNTDAFKKDWQEKLITEQSPKAAAVRTMARLYFAFPERGAYGLLEGAYLDWKKSQGLAPIEGGTK